MGMRISTHGVNKNLFQGIPGWYHGANPDAGLAGRGPDGRQVSRVLNLDRPTIGQLCLQTLTRHCLYQFFRRSKLLQVKFRRRGCQLFQTIRKSQPSLGQDQNMVTNRLDIRKDVRGDNNGFTRAIRQVTDPISLSSGSSPEVGSSMTRIFGSWTMAWANLTF